MKINLLISLFTALLFAVSMPTLSAASSVTNATAHPVSATQAESKNTVSKHIKKQKHQSKLRKWWGKQTAKFNRLVQRISLGFVGFIVTLIGAMFIVLGLVIPAVGIVFLVLGIIIAFVGLLLWVLLSKIGVRVSTSNGRDPRAN
ncbi:MAG: hypothetical protein GC192_13750 [Bacteroidetes bacterium]|nr:hypothetical protein [Bacteroidota bacterium]